MEICVCILAHNEEKHIAETILAIVRSCGDIPCIIKVYANGCSDRTEKIVKDLSITLPNLYLRKLNIASKPNAWNVAFYENSHDILVFSDGDVSPDTNVIKTLYKLLSDKNSNIALAGCSLCPKNSSASVGKRIVGFLQMPLNEDFLSGALYAIRRHEMEKIFCNLNCEGIPLGIVADDEFLQRITPDDNFAIIKNKVYYEPPDLRDYCKYLARIRWQEEQLINEYSGLYSQRFFKHRNIFSRLKSKVTKSNSCTRLFLGIIACFLRTVIKILFHRTINNHYLNLGKVCKDSNNILSQATRSQSAK